MRTVSASECGEHASVFTAITVTQRAAMQVENARNTGRLQPGDVFVDRFDTSGGADGYDFAGTENHYATIEVVGHLIERKDPLLALEAFAELARMRRGARLVFARVVVTSMARSPGASL